MNLSNKRENCVLNDYSFKKQKIENFTFVVLQLLKLYFDRFNLQNKI